MDTAPVSAPAESAASVAIESTGSAPSGLAGYLENRPVTDAGSGELRIPLEFKSAPVDQRLKAGMTLTDATNVESPTEEATNVAVAPIGDETAIATSLPLSSGDVSPVGGYFVTATSARGSIEHSAVALTSAALPVITAPPASVAVMVGAPAIFSVTATGTPAPTYQWQRQPAGSTGFANVTGASYSVGTASTLTVSATTLVMSGDQFRCVVSNGTDTVSTAAATLTVTQAVSITSAATASFRRGVANSFTVTATGAPAPTFSISAGTLPAWATLNATTGVISGTPTTAVGAPFSFTIRASNGVGTPALQNFVLAVAPAAEGLASLSWRNVVTSSGVTAFFRVEGTGTKSVLIRAAGPALTTFGVSGALADPRLELMNATGAVIGSNDDWGGASALNSAFQQVGVFPFVSGSKDAALLVSLSPGFYSVRVSGPTGSSGQALLEIYEADAAAARVATFSYLAVRGPFTSTSASFVLSGAASSPYVLRLLGPALGQLGTVADPSLSLYSGAGVLLSANNNWESSAGVEAVSAVVTKYGAIPLAAGGKDSALAAPLAPGSYLLQSDSSGLMQAEIFDGAIAGSPRAPFLYQAPAAQSVVAGQTATFTVQSGGTTPLSYQWRRNGVDLLGATGASYSFTASAADSASYDVKITNSVGSIISAGAAFTATAAVAPRVSVLTGGGNLLTGGSVSFAVSASGSAPLTYQWRKNAAPILGATASTLALADLATTDSGNFDVVVTNLGGSVTSGALVLSVTVPIAPAITAQPVGATLNPGGSGVLKVAATGNPAPSYQWRKNSTAIAGATAGSYAIGAVSAASGGSYDVVISNLAGSVTSNPAVLIVSPPVVFTTRPLDTTAASGTVVTFTAAATGNPGTPTYQWRKNGVPIPGATEASYIILNTPRSAAGSYDVVGTVPLGSVTSTAAVLTVVDLPPGIGQAPVGATLAVGGSFTLAPGITGSQPMTYQWKRDGVTVAGATGASLTIANAQPYQAGTYTMTMTNAFGSFTTAPVALAVVPRVAAYSSRLMIDEDGAVAVFTIEGSLSKKVLLRAVGPGLAPFGVTGLADPQLELFNSTGTLLANNNDWSAAANAAAIADTSAAVGAFALLPGGRDSAILTTLTPGTYTVRASPASGSAGIGFLELYDADLASRPMSVLPYVAVRGRMAAGNGIVIGGLGATSRGVRSYLLRAIGPGLGLAGALANPSFQVVRDNVLVGSNDDWDASATEAAATTAATARVATFALPAGARDSALVLTGNLHAGASTVQVGSGDAAGGIVLLELHDLDAARPASFLPTIVSPPKSTTAEAGAPVALRVLASGTGPMAYQWRKEGVPIAGATASVYALPAAAAAHGGNYTVVVQNALGSATSIPATLTVLNSGAPTATQAVVGTGYIGAGTVTITNTFSYTGTPSSLGWQVRLPEGWTFASDSGNTGQLRPTTGMSGTLEWAWINLPPSPVTFTYTLNIPAGTYGPHQLVAGAVVRNGSTLVQLPATPNPLAVAQIVTHTADTNSDYRIGLVELTRVIELYNARTGTVRTGRYREQTATDDGFAPDRTTSPTAAVALTHYHSADTDGDARINLSELTRVIELYNTRSGSTRTGAYHLQAGTEDGFAPGP